MPILVHDGRRGFAQVFNILSHPTRPAIVTMLSRRNEKKLYNLKEVEIKFGTSVVSRSRSFVLLQFHEYDFSNNNANRLILNFFLH